MSEIQVKASPAPGPDAQAKEKRRAELARKARRFRILIIGRANAGKTTILKKICNTTDDPEIHDSKGNKIDTSNIEPTNKRGFHDIDNEMVFRSNPGFVFHDSRGFEAGGADELQKVKDFVSKRSKERELTNQVHVIWYCIPMDNARPITHAEIQFFTKSGMGKVPVIVVFTKCEALELKAIKDLEEHFSYDDAVEKAADYAKEKLWKAHEMLEQYKYPPRAHVYLQEMEKHETNCKELVECTASILDNHTLQALFVSTQQASLEISIKYAIRGILTEYLKSGVIDTHKLQGEGEFWWAMLRKAMIYFPYWMVVSNCTSLV